MRSALVLGSGHSGVAAVAATLVAAGRAVGPTPTAPDARQPLGRHRAAELDALVEHLLRPGAAPRPRTAAGRAWLAPRRPNAAVRLDARAAATLDALTAVEPFCLAHPGLVPVLAPVAARVPADAARIVVFRDPATTVAALADGTARDPQERLHTADDHLAHWTRTYRDLIAAADAGSAADWVFVELDDFVHGDGFRRVAEAVGGAVPDALEPLAPRAPVADELTGPAADGARALLAELRRRAGRVDRDAPAQPARPLPRVAAIAFADAADAAQLADLRRRVAAQRGVVAELLVVDSSPAGDLAVDGATVVHEPLPSRGAALARAAAATDADLVALVDVAAVDLPWRLRQAADALAAHPELDLVTADFFVGEGDRLVERGHPGDAGDVPPPCWWTTLVLRRGALVDAPRVAFRRTELTLLADARRRGTAGHLDRPATTVDAAAFRAAADGARADAALLASDARALAAEVAPALTVLCCTFQRRDTLVRGLESFARQELPPGTFELVVVNDGSTDGTAELLEGLELPVPTRVVQRPNGKLAAARNSGLAVARGELVLLVNDDTIAFPDLVEQHLRAHRRLEGEKVCVLGTFEQRPEALDNALLRYLEGSWEVFGYADLEAGAYTDALHFYTCNVSVPLAALRDCGGYDRTFRHYGCEDTDVGVRLEERGYRVFFEDRARAYHDDRFGFDYLKRRQRLVARAFVRLFLRHPSVRGRWPGRAESLAVAAEELWPEADLARAERGARALAAVDVGALEALGDREGAEAILETLGALVRCLHRQWWLRGTVDGLRAQGLSGLDEVMAHEGEPLALTTARPRRLAAWPRWDDDASLDRVFAVAGPSASDPRVALVLRFDPARDGDRGAALARLEAAYARAFPGGESVEIDLVEGALPDRWAWHRLRRAIDATVVVGDEPDEFLRFVDVERLCTPDDSAQWLATFGPADPPAPALRAGLPVGPELSVVVPTHDRPRELEQLLIALCGQDLGAERFEVIVVDDGSPSPAAEVVDARAWPFAVRCLRQDRAGPGAARNRGTAEARGAIVVFFNDDALPVAGCLAAHLAAQRGDVVPHAVLGAFPLVGEQRTDAFAELMERSTMLFAQSAMKGGILYHGLAFCTGNVSIRRALLERVGGFDANLPFAGAEDSELGLRLERELGLRVRYEPRALAGHDHALTIRGFARRQRVLGWCVAQMAAKHGDPSLIEPGLERVDDAWWSALGASLEGSDGDLAGLVDAIERSVVPEPDAARRAAQAEALRPHVERVRDLAFRQGLFLAGVGVAAGALAEASVDAFLGARLAG